MRTNIATIIGNEIYGPNGMRLNPEHSECRAVVMIRAQEIEQVDDVAEIVTMLARIVKLAQILGTDDQRRVREFVEATRSTLAATTRLPGDDQRAFEMALRCAARQ